MQAVGAATLQDVMARFEANHGDWTKLPEKAIFQLNDTHPTIAVPELMRLLMDVKVGTDRLDSMQDAPTQPGSMRADITGCSADVTSNLRHPHRVWTGMRHGR